jgi:hypothetical protein
MTKKMTKKLKKSKSAKRVKPHERKKKKASRGVKRKVPPISAAEVRRLGFECENLATADAEAGTKKLLSDILPKFPKLKEAWERGQFLRNLQALAGVVATVSEAAHKLGMPSGEALRDMIDTDPEVGDIWKQTRLNTIIEAREALLVAAKDGNHVAIRAVENYLREEKQQGPGARADTTRLRQTELVELFRVTRITIADWYNKQGMPRNADKTYNLAEVIRWYGDYVKRKVGGRLLPADDLRVQKAEMTRLDVAERKHQLLEREEVITGLVGRWQKIVGAFGYKRRELAGLVHGQTIDNIEELLGRFFEDLQREWLTVPEFLYLPEKAAEKLAECMKLCQTN